MGAAAAAAAAGSTSRRKPPAQNRSSAGAAEARASAPVEPKIASKANDAPASGGETGGAGAGAEVAEATESDGPPATPGPSAGLGWKEGCLQSPHTKNLILTIIATALGMITVGCQASGVAEQCTKQYPFSCFGCNSTCNFANFNEDGGYGAFIGAYCFYLIECFVSNSSKYLRRAHLKETVYEYVERIKGNPPLITWHIQCYHYETRTYTEYYTDSNGNSQSRTRTETVRVNTHSASGSFDYISWRDISGMLTGLERWLLTKITYTKSYCFDDPASEAAYEGQKASFIRRNDTAEYL